MIIEYWTTPGTHYDNRVRALKVRAICFGGATRRRWHFKVCFQHPAKGVRPAIMMATRFMMICDVRHVARRTRSAGMARCHLIPLLRHLEFVSVFFSSDIFTDRSQYTRNRKPRCRSQELLRGCTLIVYEEQITNMELFCLKWPVRIRRRACAV